MRIMVELPGGFALALLGLGALLPPLFTLVIRCYYPFFSTKEKVKESLAIWHTTGHYPLTVIKVGWPAKYRLSDIKDFVAQGTITHTSSF